MSSPRWFGVSSPEYQTYSGDELDPAEYGRDWLPVFTASKRRARVLALRAWRRNPPVYPHSRRSFVSEWEPSTNPFAGMLVEPLDYIFEGKGAP